MRRGRSSTISSGGERRTRRAAALAAALALLAPGAVRAHSGPAPAVPASPDPPERVVRAEKVGEGAWCLFGKGGNVGVVATPAGLLVIDTQYEDVAPEILETISGLSDAPIEFIVNTHFHPDHVGGNAVMAAGAKQAWIVGHENVRRRMYEGPAEWVRSFPSRIADLEGRLAGDAPLGERARGVFEGVVSLLKRRLDEAKAFDPGTVVAPGLTYGDSMRIFLGGEEMVLLHLAPGHTDGDSMVWIPGRGVLHMGDLFWNGLFPFIDVDGGGATEGWLRNLDGILSRIPGETRVIAGHGPVAGTVELRRFRGYLADLREAVAGARRAGSSLADAIESIRLDGYEDLASGSMSIPRNVQQVWQEMDAAEER